MIDSFPTPQDPGGKQFYGMRFHGTGVDLALIVLKNILLSIVTIGIYSFWGKTNLRRFIWNNAEFAGHRLIYHGTGKELMRGYAKVIGIFIAINIINAVASALFGEAGRVVSGLVAICLLCLIPYAIYQSHRYLYSRTTWRGIRFGMKPEWKPFVAAFIKGYLLTLVTLGLYTPVLQNQLYRIRMDNSRIGSLEVRYTGSDKDAFYLFLKALPLIILTLGIYYFWYKAQLSCFRATHTWLGSPTLGAARGHLNLQGSEYFGFMLVNIIGIICTLGLAIPWVIAYNMAFMLRRFAFVGQLDFDEIQQVESFGSAAADGMADIMGVGFGV